MTLRCSEATDPHRLPSVFKEMSTLRSVVLAISSIAIVACQSARVATAPSPVAGAAPTSRSLQMIVVITDDWNSVPGVMRRYVRDGVRSSWRPVGAETPVVVGAAGLGWGDGLHGVGSPG